MTRPFVPQSVLDAAHARAAARATRDWAAADRLRDEIEAAGWRVVDRGTDFRLEPASPPDVPDEAGMRFGRSESVPSRLGEPSTCPATVVLVATDRPDDLDRALAALRSTSPAGTQLVVVADAPDRAQAERLPRAAPDRAGGTGLEVVRTSARLGAAAARNIGLRRASGEIVIFMDTGVEPAGDVVTPLVEALRSSGVAVVGARGLASADLRRFGDVETGEAAAIGHGLLAFRRADAALAGPLDEAFRAPPYLDVWWSLVLRDRGSDAPPRRAVVVGALPLVRHAERVTVEDAAEDERQSRRNFYRVLARFGRRPDLAVPGRVGPVAATRSEQPASRA